MLKLSAWAVVNGSAPRIGYSVMETTAINTQSSLPGWTDSEPTPVPTTARRKKKEPLPIPKVGSPIPDAYIARADWAAVQLAGGLEQTQGTDGLWRFPQEETHGTGTR